jgi:hypothetical protein
MFSLLYLEKLSVGSVTFRLGIPLLIMGASVTWMILSNNLHVSGRRLCWYMVFVGGCVLSQILAGLQGSLPSVLDVVMVYGFLIIATDLSEADFQQFVLKRFINFMILPAVIVLFQYLIQKVAGMPDPLNMNLMVPKSLLTTGYYYNAPYPTWTSKFTRPNGFFFLEPSFVSMFTASAAIIDMTYFRRPKMIALMVLATFLSTGGTGTTMLLVASPFLLAREKPKVVLTVAAAVLGGLVLAVVTGHGDQLPLVSRLSELDQHDVGPTTASAGARMVVPLTKLFELLADGGYYITGTGAGSTTVEYGSAWPIVKILKEYGAVVMVVYFIMFVVVIFGDVKSNLPLKVTIFFVFQFTGGYLLDDPFLIFIALLCMNQPPKIGEISLASTPRREVILTEAAGHV